MSAPLTSPECDLRAFPTMPLDAVRLFGSRFHAITSDAAWRAGVTLWLRSWHQVPAASLPDDDVELARLAELGRDVKAWRKFREQALHGWIRCTDGRLYHPVIAEMANAAWEKRKAFKERSAKGNGKRWGSNKDKQNDPNAILEGQEKDSFNDPKGEEREREREYSDTNVSGTIVPLVDPEKVAFDCGIRFLAQSGITEVKARPLIGKWKKDHGSGAVIEALGAAQRGGIMNPIPWIEARWRQHKRAVGSDEWVSPC